MDVASFYVIKRVKRPVMAGCAIDSAWRGRKASVSGSNTVQAPNKHDRTLIPSLIGSLDFPRFILGLLLDLRLEYDLTRLF